ncbi:MAG: dTDP-4-dehydrorhamnose reductase [Sphingomonadales bacterium]|jgi:dTDP-4-dehydrorhamnose reductase|nr:dTDP-4-dehydrorhamnose reductase [Sphingomonadales bacterium]
MTPALVIGRSGQLALSLAERAKAEGRPLVFVGRPDTDLEDAASLRHALLSSGAGIVVNAAAYTAVDQAEDEPDRAWAQNAEAPRILAEAARDAGARLIHVSTDYVFDGSGDAPRREGDPTGPAGVYGRTKLAGEEAIRAVLPGHAIVRTAWVYSPFGRNFVKTMLALARSRPALRVVGDQVGNPTSALDLAEGLLALVRTWEREPDRGAGATYHLAGTGSASWAEFAQEIFAFSAARGGPTASVEAIATADWPAKAPRPLNSRLDSTLFAETFGYRAPPWRESLALVVERLLAEGEG